jgi:thioredoxin-like negative regulator of GroEL
MIAPELEKIARARAGSLLVAKVNTDELPALGARFGVQGIPTLVLLREGQEATRVSGAMPAAALERALGL